MILPRTSEAAMRRREFLTGTTALAISVAGGAPGLTAFAASGPRIMTVGGWIPAQAMGVTLAHEHALANFAGYDAWTRRPYPYVRQDVVNVVLPRLLRLRQFGVRTFVDATAAFLGRDPSLLAQLSQRSGLNILTVTGNYAAFDNRFLPPWAFTDTPEQLAARWVAEWDHGIEQTAVRPGFIKLGFNGGPLSMVERNLIRAGAVAHLKTGLTIGAHTGPAVSALEQLAELVRAGVHPSAWIWIHAQNEKDPARHLEAARRGAWIEFDGIDPSTIDLHVTLVTRMRDAALLDRILISQDAGWYAVGEPRGGDRPRSYETMFTHFLPALRARGFGSAEIETLLVHNPARAFAVAVRRAT
jgi:phosphotriesterase-related protein